jgi:hypothetical protein
VPKVKVETFRPDCPRYRYSIRLLGGFNFN